MPKNGTAAIGPFQGMFDHHTLAFPAFGVDIHTGRRISSRNSSTSEEDAIVRWPMVGIETPFADWIADRRSEALAALSRTSKLRRTRSHQ
jgi:hypothetical protein